jgi:transcriptional regulator with XRE-family HTH domain
MTILSDNLKTIRKNHKYTQVALSEFLQIGFRTYVRYKAGERDAPVSVLVKLARLGNLSLDQLLTTKVLPEDLQTLDKEKLPNFKAPLEIISGGLEEGRLMFKGQLNDNLISTNKEEQKLLTLFRKLNPSNREKYLLDAEWIYTNTRKSVRYPNPKKNPSQRRKSQNCRQTQKTGKIHQKNYRSRLTSQRLVAIGRSL